MIRLTRLGPAAAGMLLFVGLSVSTGAGAAGPPSASGHANLTFGDGLETLSFAARERSDGTVTGVLQIENHELNVHAHVAIDCMEIIGNMAILSGVVVGESRPQLVGASALIAVVDNGEGSGDPPDLSTDLFLNPGPLPNLCHEVGPPPDGLLLLPIEGGNIQIQP